MFLMRYLWNKQDGKLQFHIGLSEILLHCIIFLYYVFLFKYFTIFCVWVFCLHVYLCRTCMQCAECPGAVISSCGCQELSLDPLEERPLLLAAEISPALYYLVFLIPPTKVHRLNTSMDFPLLFNGSFTGTHYSM